MAADPVEIARALLRCPSVTPADAGALGIIENALRPAGFEVHRVTFAELGTAPVENLYARIGVGVPHLVFAGHTDVVPPGDEAKWAHPPFGGDVVNDTLHGRGAVDMKGGIACAIAATLDYLGALGSRPSGSISFLTNRVTVSSSCRCSAVNSMRVSCRPADWEARRGHRQSRTARTTIARC